MGDLTAFVKRLKDQLTTSRRAPHWEPDEAERYMAAIASRRDKFDALAAQLIETVIQPRLETLASYLSNASLSTDEPTGRCSRWFRDCERFPASTKVSLSVEHDVRCEKVAVCYDAAMMP